MSDGIDKSTDMTKPVILRERLTRHVLRSIMSQFSSLPEALLELVDNAFDEFDGVHGGRHLDIDIVITKGSITVENEGGKGMGVIELQNWLDWGVSGKVDSIGEYGQGGKAAMGYLGSSWKIHSKRWDESKLWGIKEEKWDDVSCTEKVYEAVQTEYKRLQGIGYCKFEITNLKKHRQDINRIKEELSNIYRRYLDEGRATIRVNYEPIRPLMLPLYEGHEVHKFSEKTALGFNIKGWIGRLKRDVRVRREPRIAGGMRLLRKGRLIKAGEYFGHPDFKYKASLGTLIGEVELSKIPVLPNKTGFDTDSLEWATSQEIMYKILKPHINELLSQREEETVTREEKKRVAQVRNLMIEAFKLLSKYSDLSSKFGDDTGRKRPERGTEEEEVPKSLYEERTTKTREPRTPPPMDAIGKLRRLGRMPDWEVRILDPDIRSDWGEREGHRCLLINKMYCLYEQRDGDDLYIAETAALQLARPEGDEKLTMDEYLYGVNQLMRAFCEVYDTNIS